MPITHNYLGKKKMGLFKEIQQIENDNASSSEKEKLDWDKIWKTLNPILDEKLEKSLKHKIKQQYKNKEQ